MRVLVFHANPELRWSLEELAKDHGHVTFGASEVESAKAKLDIGAFDAILTEASHPGPLVNLLKAVRHSRHHPRVIVLASRHDPLDDIRALWPIETARNVDMLTLALQPSA